MPRGWRSSRRPPRRSASSSPCSGDFRSRRDRTRSASRARAVARCCCFRRWPNLVEKTHIPASYVTAPQPRFRLSTTSDRMIATAIVVVLAFGVTLRVWQYQHDAALWIDEIAVARNVIDRPMSRLLVEPLAYGQTAPKGFLLIEKLAIALAGPSERAFRAWPFVASIGSLGLFAIVAIRIIGAGGGLVALSSFAFAGPLIRYAATLKQYSTDVTVCLLLLALALPRHDGRPRTGLIAAISGAVAIWFSQPAIIVAAALIAMIAVQATVAGGVRALARTAVQPQVMLWTASAGVAAIVATLS